MFSEKGIHALVCQWNKYINLDDNIKKLPCSADKMCTMSYLLSDKYIGFENFSTSFFFFFFFFFNNPCIYCVYVSVT